MKLLYLFFLLISLPTFGKELLLTSENTVQLKGPVTRQSVGEVMQELNSLSQKGKPEDPIFLVLNTPGGSVMAGLDLMEYVNTIRRPVYAVANYAASMGFHILQNSPIRYVTRYATIMSHRASGGFSGDIPQQINSRLKHVIDLIEKMDESVIARTKGKYNKESYMELIRDEYYGVGSNAIDDGFADEVVSLKCDESLNEIVEKSIQVFIFTAKVKFSRCPLITQPIVDNEENRQQILDFLNRPRVLEP